MKTENTIPDTIPAPLADALARMMMEIDEAFAALRRYGIEDYSRGSTRMHVSSGSGTSILRVRFSCWPTLAIFDLGP